MNKATATLNVWGDPFTEQYDIARDAKSDLSDRFETTLEDAKEMYGVDRNELSRYRITITVEPINQSGVTATPLMPAEG